MAKIPLRKYTQEIDNLIERGEIEKAIAHAKNILRSYPKHIETYRLLGKAYLESQRYSEAVDILGRILSVLPDDFTAQIGMSIIREDEGNLDAAIWHMERAYEVQPFNPAVQEELRRLYGQRDGVEPPKIRLTRGALIRMYERGELYPQAIAETRAALAEDPQRIDLQVLLAQLYSKTGQKVEAIEVCSTLLSKLPYCYEAIRLLAQVLPGTSRAEDAQLFQQRLKALDPYAAFISPTTPTSEQVPDQAVSVEEFIFEPSLGDNQAAPEWARSAGVDWQKDEPKEELPDWLNTLAPTQATPTPYAEPASHPTNEQVETSEGEKLIPEWMREAGWAPSDGAAEQPPAPFDEDEALEPEEAAPAEIPDWMQELAPPPVEQQTDQQRAEWLTDIVPGEQTEQPTVESISQAKEEEVSMSEISDLPDWLTGMVSDAPEVEDLQPPSDVQEDASTAEMPRWLSQMGTEENDDAAMPTAQTEQEEQEQPPWMAQTWSSTEESPSQDWLQALGAETIPGESVDAELGSAEELPDWMRQPTIEETEAPVEQENAAVFETPVTQETTDQEIQAAKATAFEESAAKDTASEETASSDSGMDISDMYSAMAWLKSLAAKQGADEATLTTTPDERQETPPDWVQHEMEKQGLAGEELHVENEPPAATEPEVELLSQQEAPNKADIEEEIPAVSAEEEIQQAGEASTETEGMPDFSDMDAAMAWLEIAGGQTRSRRRDSDYQTRTAP